MKHKALRITIAIITGFIALTAIGGGIALLTGAEGQRFPLDWLQGTPFKDYTIPALLLTVAVGGSSLLACIAIIRDLKTGMPAALAAGMIMVGFIVIEVLILKQVPPGPTPIEIMYFILGLTTILLAGFLRQKR
jgi:hypothetical protein